MSGTDLLSNNSRRTILFLKDPVKEKTSCQEGLIVSTIRSGEDTSRQAAHTSSDPPPPVGKVSVQPDLVQHPSDDLVNQLLNCPRLLVEGGNRRDDPDA